MEIKKLEGPAYSVLRRLVHEWLEANPEVEILKIRDRRTRKKRVIWIFYK